VRGLVGAGLVPLVWHGALAVAVALERRRLRGWCATAALAGAVLGLLGLVFGGEYQLSQRLQPLLPQPLEAVAELAVVAALTAAVWRPCAAPGSRSRRRTASNEDVISARVSSY